MKAYQQEFIQNLKNFRHKKKLSQAQLSELCDVATGTIGNIECGLSKPSFDLILTLADVLEVHPALLFSAKPIVATSTMEKQTVLLIKEEIDELLARHIGE